MIDKWLDKLIEAHFWILMAGVLLLGVCLLALSRCFGYETLPHDLIRDLGIATVVSFCVTIIIEYYSSRRREADIRSGVLNAILGKVVPPVVWEEIRAILAHPVLCEEWHLDATVSEEQITQAGSVQPENRYLVTGTLTYKLRNLINRELTEVLSHELQFEIKGKDNNGLEIPCFIRLTSTPSTGKPTNWTADELKNPKYLKEAMLSVPVTLPASDTGSVDISLKRKEILLIPSGYPWYMNWVTIAPRITIKTDLTNIGFETLARHPNHKQLQTIIQNEEWLFPGVMFPGQGFDVICTKK
jgi:hypothetical protein